MLTEATPCLSFDIAQVLWDVLRLCAGYRWPRPTPAYDNLEPYCREAWLQQRRGPVETLDPGTARAIHKIGARYGVEL